LTEYFLVMFAVLLPAVLLPQKRPSSMAWWFAFVLLLLFIGLRHKVGMDWNNYLVMAWKVQGVPWYQAPSVAEPGYAFVLWASERMGFGVYGANLFSAALLLAGTLRVSRSTKLPWLALVCAYPMLLVVVGMSAGRQTAAIGILMLLAASWEQASLTKRVSLTLLASLFHLSAIFFLCFAVAGRQVNLPRKIAELTIFGTAAAYFLVQTGGADYYDQAYITGQSELTFSPGATQHVLLNGIPAAIYLLSRRLRSSLPATALLTQMAWLALVLIPASYYFSLAAGRMTLYLFPVSMIVLSGLPALFSGNIVKAIIRTLIAGAQVGILGVWLYFANSSHAYIPYSNVLFRETLGWER